MSKPTIYDIARQSGTSPATVSRVLNQKGYVSPETRHRVEQTIQKLGYTHHAPFSPRPASPAKTIGVLVPDIRYEHCTNVVFYIEQELSTAGYSCILCNANNNYDKAIADLNVLTKKKVDGLILVNTFFCTKQIKDWLRDAELKIPIVCLFGALDLPGAYNLRVDIDGCSNALVQALTERGKNRFAAIRSKNDPGSAWAKQSLAKAMIGKLSNYIPLEVTLQENTLNAGYSATKKLLQEHPDINAVIFDDTVAAIGACRFLEEAGILIPESVAICVTDKLTLGEMVRPRLACIDNHPDIVGREAAHTVMDLLNGLSRPHTMTLSVDILPRETL